MQRASAAPASNNNCISPLALLQLQGEADATWVFMGWEGIEAELKGVKLNVFGLEDYNVTYGHSPLLVAHPDTLG